MHYLLPYSNPAIVTQLMNLQYLCKVRWEAIKQMSQCFLIYSMLLMLYYCTKVSESYQTRILLPQNLQFQPITSLELGNQSQFSLQLPD